MGCVSSSVKDDPPPGPEHAAAGAAAAPPAGGSVGASSPPPAAGTGVPPPSDVKVSEEQAEKAKIQRRRLSVAPRHVGDISAAQAALSEEEKKAREEHSGLTEQESKCKGRLRDILRSRKGIVPYNRNKVNQDRAIIKYALGDDADVSLFGVMDGHGEFGHQVAQFVQDKLPVYLAAETELKSEPEKAILAGVHKMCEKLKDTNINAAFSGTTSIFAVKVGLELYVCNIGDSRCVLCRQGAGGEIQAIGLSTDQKPENPKEKERIIAAGGRVEPLPGPPGEDCGPPRVWLLEVDVPGLAMSRSIGDVVSQSVGVISVPDIVHHTLQENDIFAIWASDGVWEFVNNKEAVAIVWKYRDNLQEAADRLIEESSKRWKEHEEVIDDITCVIVAFNPAKPTETTTVTASGSVA